jgi:hypothetical protein
VIVCCPGFRRPHGNPPKIRSFVIPCEPVIEHEVHRRHEKHTRISVWQASHGNLPKHKHTNYGVTRFPRKFTETPSIGDHDETHGNPKTLFFKNCTEYGLHERSATTVTPTPPIAVGCKMGVCREHTGIPWNRRSLLSPTGPNEEMLLKVFLQRFVGTVSGRRLYRSPGDALRSCQEASRWAYSPPSRT